MGMVIDHVSQKGLGPAIERNRIAIVHKWSMTANGLVDISAT